jgi:hypothetical protein
MNGFKFGPATGPTSGPTVGSNALQRLVDSFLCNRFLIRERIFRANRFRLSGRTRDVNTCARFFAFYNCKRYNTKKPILSYIGTNFRISSENYQPKVSRCLTTTKRLNRSAASTSGPASGPSTRRVLPYLFRELSV